MAKRGTVTVDVEADLDERSIKRAGQEAQALLEAIDTELEVETQLDRKSVVNTHRQLQKMLRAIHAEIDVNPDITEQSAARLQREMSELLALLNTTVYADAELSPAAYVELQRQVRALVATIEKVSPSIDLDVDVNGGSTAALNNVMAGIGTEAADSLIHAFSHRKIFTQIFSDPQAAALKAAAGFLAFVGALAPVGPALIGVVASATALVGVLGQALVGAAFLAAGALSSLAAAGVVVALGMDGFGNAVSKGGKYLDELQPSARAAAEAIRALSEPFNELRDLIQENLFAGLGSQIEQAGNKIITVLTPALTGIAREVNTAAKGFLTFIGSAEGSRRIAELMEGLRGTLANLLPAIGKFSEGFLNLFAGSSSELIKFADSIEATATRFRDWTSEIAGNGALTNFLETAQKAGGTLLDVLGNLRGVFAAVFGAGAEAGQGLLESLEESTASMEEFFKSAEGGKALAGFFATIDVAAKAFKDTMSVLGPVIGGIGDFFDDLAPGLEKFRAAILPSAQALGKNLGDAFRTLGPAVSSLVSSLGPFAAVMLEILGLTIKYVVAGIAPLVKALALVVKVLSSALVPVLRALRVPIAFLISLFVGFGGALKLFGTIGRAISKLFGRLRVGGDSMKDGFSALKPVVDLLKRAMQLLLSPFKALGKFFAGIWKGAVQGVLNSFKNMLAGGGRLRSGLRSIFGAIGRVFTGFKNTVSNALETVVRLITGLPGRIGGIAKKMGAAGIALMTAFLQGLGSAGGALGDFANDIWNAVKAQLNNAIDKINDALPNKIGPINLPNNPFPHFARGTMFAPGGAALVGEEGPELVHLPRGSRVRSASETRQVLGNAAAVSANAADVNIHQHFYGPTTSGGRLREMDWTVKYATKAHPYKTAGVAT